MRILSGKNRLKSKKHTNRSESRPLPVDLHAPLADGYALLPFFAKDLLISAFVGSRMQCWLCAARTVPVGVENRARNGFRTRFVPNNQQNQQPDRARGTRIRWPSCLGSHDSAWPGQSSEHSHESSSRLNNVRQSVPSLLCNPSLGVSCFPSSANNNQNSGADG
jgi:hypothetical protein